MRTATATAGRWARIPLLVGTLLGLAAMHTLGHGTHGTGHSADAATHADAATRPAATAPRSAAESAPHSAAVTRAAAVTGATDATRAADVVTRAAIAVTRTADVVPRAAIAVTRTADVVPRTAAATHSTVAATRAADTGPHGGEAPERQTAVSYAAAVAPPPGLARQAVAGGAGCPGDCPHERLLPSGGAGGGLPWWGVCLAVLGALAVPLLLAVLLLAGVRAVGPLGRASGGPERSPRAPPSGPVGLRLATVSVLRR
ncbi:hypothetical protein ACWENR_05070 [Micromonospora sp. NPDC004336]